MHAQVASPTSDVPSYALAAFELRAIADTFRVSGGALDVPFDYAGYSEFKYGRRDLAEHFGSQLASILGSHLLSTAKGEPIVVMGTPYKRLPNAAKLLALTVVQRLRAVGQAVRYTSVYQHRLSEGDYGRLSLAEREIRNQQKKRLVDPDDFAGRHVVVIDDVRITGSIERSIAALLEGVPIRSLTFTNLVRLHEEDALLNPGLEDRLNHFAVTGLQDIARLMHGPHGFVLITRVLKYVLETDPTRLPAFLEQLSFQEVDDLYEGAIDEGYDEMPRYRAALDVVRASYEARSSRLLLTHPAT